MHSTNGSKFTLRLITTWAILISLIFTIPTTGIYMIATGVKFFITPAMLYPLFHVTFVTAGLSQILWSYCLSKYSAGYCASIGEIYDIVVEYMIRQSAGLQG